MPDLQTQLRDYFESIAPPDQFEFDREEEFATVLQPTEQPGRRRGWTVALAAAVVVLVLIGGAAALLLLGGEEQPVIEEPVPTTVLTPTTEPAPETTAAEPPAEEAFVPIAGWAEVGEGSASLGGVSDSTNQEQITSLAVAPEGTPYVAWESSVDGGEPFEVYVKRFNGTSWEEVGEGSASGAGLSNSSDADSRLPSIAIAPDGTPYVAWEEGEERGFRTFHIYVKRFTGSVWEEVGQGSASGAGLSNNSEFNTALPQLAIAPDGTPYVAWWTHVEDQVRGPGTAIYVKRFDGTAWREVGEGSATGEGVSRTGAAEQPALAIGPDGSVYIAWTDAGVPGGAVHVRRFDGSVWQEVGDGSASGQGISESLDGSEPSFVTMIVAPDGTPYVAWNEQVNGKNQIYSLAFNGTVWQQVGETLANGDSPISDPASRLSLWPSMAISPAGVPHVAWQAQSQLVPDSGFGIYVRRFTGTEWEEVGLGSGSGPGMSQGPNAVHASLAYAPDGTLYLVWKDAGIGNGEIAALMRSPG